jgi:hypothetical protein
MKKIAAVTGAALILFALGFNLARDKWPDTSDHKGAPTYTYSTTYSITRWEIRPEDTSLQIRPGADPPSPLDGSDLPRVSTAPSDGK